MSLNIGELLEDTNHIRDQLKDMIIKLTKVMNSDQMNPAARRYAREVLGLIGASDDLLYHVHHVEMR